MDEVDTDLDFSGLSAQVPAGNHGLAIGYGCDTAGGLISGSSLARLVVGGVLVG